MYQPGIYADISNAEYHASEGLSASGLKLLARSPAHFRFSVREETPAMRKGTAAHAAVFEPERFAAEYIAAPDIDKRTKAGKEAWAALEASGKIVLAAKEYADVTGMARAVHSHLYAAPLVSGGTAEQSVFWEYNAIADDIETPILLKARPDYIKPMSSGYIIVDLKTTKDARPYSFESDIFKLGYHIQAAHYTSGMNNTSLGTPQAFFFVSVESDAPHGIIVYELDETVLLKGYEEITRLYSLYAQCRKYDKWPSYPEEIIKLKLPSWAA